ncbi:MAG: HEPN domain-containing protein [Candidatus Nanohalobium sp.]
MSEQEITVGPGASTVESPTERERLAERKKSNSDYFLNAARNLLGTDTPAGVFVLGHLAAEKKVEQALALKGYKVNTHLCTIKGLGRVLEEKELSKDMNRIYKRRQDVNYETEITETIEEEAENFMSERVEPFIEEMNSIIEDLK